MSGPGFFETFQSAGMQAQPNMASQPMSTFDAADIAASAVQANIRRVVAAGGDRKAIAAMGSAYNTPKDGAGSSAAAGQNLGAGTSTSNNAVFNSNGAPPSPSRPPAAETTGARLGQPQSPQGSPQANGAVAGGQQQQHTSLSSAQGSGPQQYGGTSAPQSPPRLTTTQQNLVAQITQNAMTMAHSASFADLAAADRQPEPAVIAAAAGGISAPLTSASLGMNAALAGSNGAGPGAGDAPSAQLLAAAQAAAAAAATAVLAGHAVPDNAAAVFGGWDVSSTLNLRQGSASSNSLSDAPSFSSHPSKGSGMLPLGRPPRSHNSYTQAAVAGAHLGYVQPQGHDSRDFGGQSRQASRLVEASGPSGVYHSASNVSDTNNAAQLQLSRSSTAEANAAAAGYMQLLPPPASPSPQQQQHWMRGVGAGAGMVPPEGADTLMPSDLAQAAAGVRRIPSDPLLAADALADGRLPIHRSAPVPTQPLSIGQPHHNVNGGFSNSNSTAGSFPQRPSPPSQQGSYLSQAPGSGVVQPYSSGNQGYYLGHAPGSGQQSIPGGGAGQQYYYSNQVGYTLGPAGSSGQQHSPLSQPQQPQYYQSLGQQTSAGQQPFQRHNTSGRQQVSSNTNVLGGGGGNDGRQSPESDRPSRGNSNQERPSKNSVNRGPLDLYPFTPVSDGSNRGGGGGGDNNRAAGKGNRLDTIKREEGPLGAFARRVSHLHPKHSPKPRASGEASISNNSSPMRQNQEQTTPPLQRKNTAEMHLQELALFGGPPLLGPGNGRNASGAVTASSGSKDGNKKAAGGGADSNGAGNNAGKGGGDAATGATDAGKGAAVSKKEEVQDDDGDLEGEEAGLPWYRRKQWQIVMFIIPGIILLIVGISLQATAHYAGNNMDAFRWFYFFAAWPLLWYGTDACMSKVFDWIEFFFFRESLLYLKRVEMYAHPVLFILLLLPWFQAMFVWAWCGRGRCDNAVYRRAIDIMWKLLLCTLMFCLANLLKSIIAKLLSTHFYRTAHFKKLQLALLKEYYLQVLSRPRVRKASSQDETYGAHLFWLARPTASRLVSMPARTVSAAVASGKGGGADHETKSLVTHSMPPVTDDSDSDGLGDLPEGTERQVQELNTSLHLQHTSSMPNDERRGAAGIAGQAPLALSVGGALPGVTAVAVEPGFSGFSENVFGRSTGHVMDSRSASGVDVVNPAASQSQPQVLLQLPLLPGAGESSQSFLSSSDASALIATGYDPAQNWQLQQQRMQGGVGGTSGQSQPQQPHTLNAGQLQLQLAQLLPGGGSRVGIPPPPPQPAPGWAWNAAAGLPRKSPPASAAGAAAGVPATEVVANPDSVTLTVQEVGPTSPNLSAAAGSTSAAAPAGAVAATTLMHTIREVPSHESLTAMAAAAAAAATAAVTTSMRSGAAPLPAKSGSRVGLLGADYAASDSAAASDSGGVVGGEGGGLSSSTVAAATVAAAIAAKRARDAAAMPPPPPRSPHNVNFPAGTGGGGPGGGGNPISPIMEGDRPGGNSAFEEASKKEDKNERSRPLYERSNSKTEVHPVLGMSPAVLDTVPTQNTDKKQDPWQMSSNELAKVRVAVVIKTYTALVRKHTRMSESAQAAQLRAVKRFAKALFINVRGEDEEERLYLTPDDFKAMFDDEDQAVAAFAVFDADNDGTVTDKELQTAVEAIYNERANMALQLKDTDSIVGSLEFSIGFLVHLLAVATYLLIWGVDIVRGFSTFSATLLSLTFVFGNSIRAMYEATLFLFVEHPYDVGDTVIVNGEGYVIKKMSLLYTEMVKGSGERIYYPSATLLTSFITNLTRSKTKSEFFAVKVDMGISKEICADIKAGLMEVKNAAPGEYAGDPDVTYSGFVDPFKTVLTIGWTYNFAADDWKRMGPAKNNMYSMLSERMAQHGLTFTLGMQYNNNQNTLVEALPIKHKMA